jgi:hypothetical protein
VAFCSGFFFAGDRLSPVLDSAPQKNSAAVAQTSVKSSERTETPILASAGEANGLPAVLSAEQARTVTFELLREPNRIERMIRMCEMLRRVSPENWREVIDGFVRQTAFEGREHDQEWKFMLQRVGEVAGADAVLDALSLEGGNREHRARNILEGWTMAKPEAALAWLRKQSPEHQRILNPAMIYGLARSAPLQALEFALGQNNPDASTAAIPEILNGAVQEGGFRKGEELIAAVLKRTDVDEAMKRNFFFALVQKQLVMSRLRDTPLDSLQWLEGYLGESSPVGPHALRQVISTAAAKDPVAAIDWLDKRSERLAPAQVIPGYTAALQAVYQKSPEQFTTWLKANQNHVAHDNLVEGYTNDLIAAGRASEASEWMKTVQNEATRQRIQAALDKNGQKNVVRP